MTSTTTGLKPASLAFAAIALTFVLMPTDLWANASSVDASFSAIDNVRWMIISFGRPVAAILIAIGGLMMAFGGRAEESMKKIGTAVLGIAIVVGALSLSNSLGFGGSVF